MPASTPTTSTIAALATPFRQAHATERTPRSRPDICYWGYTHALGSPARRRQYRSHPRDLNPARPEDLVAVGRDSDIPRQFELVLYAPKMFSRSARHTASISRSCARGGRPSVLVPERIFLRPRARIPEVIDGERPTVFFAVRPSYTRACWFDQRTPRPPYGAGTSSLPLTFSWRVVGEAPAALQGHILTPCGPHPRFGLVNPWWTPVGRPSNTDFPRRCRLSSPPPNPQPPTPGCRRRSLRSSSSSSEVSFEAMAPRPGTPKPGARWRRRRRPPDDQGDPTPTSYAPTYLLEPAPPSSRIACGPCPCRPGYQHRARTCSPQRDAQGFPSASRGRTLRWNAQGPPHRQGGRRPADSDTGSDSFSSSTRACWSGRACLLILTA